MTSYRKQISSGNAQTVYEILEIVSQYAHILNVL